MSDKDSRWAKSAKGNLWRHVNEKLLIVGTSRYGIWARCDGTFLKGTYSSLEDAQREAEAVAKFGGAA